MGKERSYKPRKRKFHGNQNTSKLKLSEDVKAEKTASELKLHNKQELCVEDCKKLILDDEISGNRIIDISILIQVFSILLCPICSSSNLFLEENSRFGLSSNFTLKCKNCSFMKGFCTSRKNNKLNEINSKFVLGLRLIGAGFSAGKKLCTILNFPSFLSKSAFRKHEEKLLKAATTVAEKCMITAAKEVSRIKNDSSSIIKECGVSVDGTWQRRGFSSLNGCVTAISVDTGKILDMEVLSQYCRFCSIIKNSSDHVCANHSGSAGAMEPVGVYRIFEKSKKIRGLKYTDYYGDGDSKAFDSVRDIYGKNSVNKLECIGHIQKRVGSRLRKLKSKQKGLGGKGKLTDAFIDKLQNYYGIAIRSNVGNLENMQSAVIAAFFHCISNAQYPTHGQCPVGSNSWCKFQRGKFSGNDYAEKSKGLPRDIVKVVKPVYMELCNRTLLKKCLHGKTQNANESFNGILWNIIPKSTFVELQTLRLGANISAILFNDGFKGVASILDELGLFPNSYTQVGCQGLDENRITDSKRHSNLHALKQRKILRAKRKKKIVHTELKEGPMYESGGFSDM